MDFIEKDLEDYILSTPIEILFKNGLNTFNRKSLVNIRQLVLTGYGVADIVRVYKENGYLCFDVIELKKDEIHSPTFWQGINYVRGLQRYLEILKFSQPYKISLTLIGSKASNKSPLLYLSSIINNDFFKINIFSYKVMNDSIVFKKELSYCSIKENRSPNRKIKRI